MSCELAVSLPYWDHNGAMRSIRQHADIINHISVFWYHLQPDGQIERYKRAHPNKSVISFAHRNNIKVFALIANLPDDEREGKGKTWDSKRVGHVLRSAAKRRKHVAAIMKLVNSMDFDGAHIDYEALPTRYREDFTRLIAALGEALHRENKELIVALHAKSARRNPEENNGSWAQDWTAIAQHADQLHLMTYSQHTASSPPGPVASITWVEAILRYAVDALDLPPEKLFVGLPLYGEEWRLSANGSQGLDQDLTFVDVEERRRAYEGEVCWSEEEASPYLTYTSEQNSTRVLWFENAQSTKRKLELMRELGLCRAAVWRLGGEDPEVWPQLRQVLGSEDDR